ncbi:hypothetical protein PG994_003111 [Apiospora phragmitis]|uniref:Uncharacterized protein n=1 Tax=Apiospora phragmitis TaxID=2905665 RepID=A0ABR1W746_9PEZI
MRLPIPPTIARGLTGFRDAAVQARGTERPATTSTAEALAGQWGNPTDISTILMIIGGDVVQKALAQGTGLWYFTPVCFSFGWVSYAFAALVNVLGDGRLLPPPDYPAKVLNLGSGYLGRRPPAARPRHDDDGDGAALRITVYDAVENRSGDLTRFRWTRTHSVALLIIADQFGLAAGPIALYGEWDIMTIVAVGTFLAQIAGSLPQWRAEKLPNRQKSREMYALTRGNGSREVVVISGKGKCFDLEELAALPNPQSGRLWEKFTGASLLSVPLLQGLRGFGTPTPTESEPLKPRKPCRLPLGFWLTRIVVTVQSILWLLLLVNVSMPRASNWFLLGIGAIGMFQNGISAGSDCDPKHRNLPLLKVKTIRSQKVMDGLMDLEVTYGNGEALLHEFFPGHLHPDEEEWWAGNKDPYDKKRKQEEQPRGTPRTQLSPKQTREPRPFEPAYRPHHLKKSPMNPITSDYHQSITP